MTQSTQSVDLYGIHEGSVDLYGIHEGKSAGLLDLDGTANGSLDFDMARLTLIAQQTARLKARRTD
jgi:hypothetical protein